ncbi:MAG: cardiolipin synthase [Alicyclobacillus sp.]|nr:cardiolipin synthase [Alicyclobacillus sp.]
MSLALWICLAVVAVLVLNAVGVLMVAVREAQTPAFALTWLVACIALPVVGLWVYRRVARRVPPRRPIHWHAPTSGASVGGEGSPLVSNLSKCLRGVASPIERADVTVYFDGSAFYQQLLTDIQSARTTIDMEFYIFRWDEVGQAVVAALLERAAAGVHIRFLRDGFGSLTFPPAVIAQMQAAGIETRAFFPLRAGFLNPTLNHRDHCKIVHIDTATAYVGGMNVGLEYTGQKPQNGPWHDAQVRILGPAARQAQAIFESDWSVSTPDVLPRQAPQSALAPPTAPPFPWRVQAAPKETVFRHADVPVQFFDSGPDHKRAIVRETYFVCLTQAEHTVDLMTPYFAPGEDLMMALKTAAARGVRVRLLLPEKVDHRLIGYACQTYFRDLVDAGVELYLWRPGVLHAKVAVVDGCVSVIGAANFDLRSFHLNYELCMISYGQPLAASLSQRFELDLASARPVTRSELDRIPWRRQVLHQSARLLAPLL